MQGNIFNTAILFAGDNPQGFTKRELEEYLGLQERDWGTLMRQFEGQHPDHVFNQTTGRGSEEVFNLTKVGYEKLNELTHANEMSETAKQTRNLAILSICIACVGAFIPLATLIIEKVWPSEIILNQEQLNRIINATEQQ